MDMQIGFDFGLDLSATFVEHVPGTWLDPELSREECERLLDVADARISRLGGPGRGLFRLGVDELRSYMEKEAFDYPRSPSFRVDVNADQVALFMAHCQGMQETNFGGIQYKFSAAAKRAAMYVLGVGTLAVLPQLHGRGDDPVLYFYPYKSSDLLDSYYDHSPVINLDEKHWGGAMSAAAMSEAHSKTPAVHPITHRGRKYIFTCIVSRGTDQPVFATGWMLCPLDDWKGPVYQCYRDHLAAYDDGRVERGDHRGALVNVAGMKYVCESHAVVTGKNKFTERK